MTAATLAAELEVSVRTIYRDVEALHAAGVPLYADAGHAGGYQLLGGYRTHLTGLNQTEAQALFLSGIPGPAAELGLAPALAAAQLKLHAALPPELRAQANRMRSRFHLDAPGWYAPDTQVPFLPPPDFDLARYWQRYHADFLTRLYAGEAVVRLSPQALPRLTRAAAQAAADTGTPEPDGWIRAVLPTESLDDAHRTFLALGTDVEVLQPPELRARLAATAHALARRYASAAV